MNYFFKYCYIFMGCLFCKKRRNEDLLSRITEDDAIEKQHEDIEKQRELAIYLVENDYSIFSQHLNEVKNLNDEQFINLFKGNTDYKGFNSSDLSGFLNLVQKFQDNRELLINWYREKKYYKIILDLWKSKAIPILKGKSESEQEIILKNNRIDTSNWDDEFYRHFKSIINCSEEDIIAKRMKKYIEANYGNIDEYVKLEEKCRQNVEQNENTSCGKHLMDNLETSMYNKIKMVGTLFFEKYSKDFDNMSKDIRNRQEQVAIEKLVKSGITESKSKEILKKVMKEYKEKKYTKNYTFNANNELKDVKDFSIKFTKGEIDELKFKDKSEIFFSNKMVKHATLGLSLINLSYSILHLGQKLMDNNNLKEQIKIRLDSIKRTFKQHKDNLKIPLDIDEAVKYIKSKYKDFNDDLNAVNQLMEDIDLAINNQENERNKAIKQTCFSGLGAGFSFFGVAVTKGSDRIEYAASSISNILTSGISATDIVMTQKNINQLRASLKEAENLEKQIQQQIENLNQEFDKLKTAHWA